MRILGFLALVAVLLFTACDRRQEGTEQTKAAFSNTDVTGLGYARDFALPDYDGKLRTLADFRGKAVVVFFGYTQCPDVCPTTMAQMATVMQQLGSLANKVQVLFITVDPERDTPELLAK